MGAADPTADAAGTPPRQPSRYARIAPYVWRQRGTLGLIALMSLAGAGIAALLPWPMKLLVDHALGDEPLPGWAAAALGAAGAAASPGAVIVACGAATLALMAASALVNAALTWSWALAGHRMVYDLATDMFARLQRMSLLHVARRSTGDLLDRITVDSWCAYRLAAELLVSPAQNVLTIAAVGVLAWSMNPGLTVLLLGAVPVLALTAHRLGGWLKRRARLQREAEARLSGFVHQVLTAIPLVQAFGRERRNAAEVEAVGEAIVSNSVRAVLAQQAFALANGMALAAGAALVLLAGAREVSSGGLTVGGLLVFVAYVQTLRVAFSGLVAGYGQIRTTEASVDRAVEILAADHALPEDGHAAPLVCRTPSRGAAIALERVSVDFGTGRPALEEVALEIGAGETMALVGETGAGKTTLASLIPRFYDPTAGRVLIDGQDVRTVALRSLRERISLVLQEPFLLPLTVAANIAYGRPGATRDEIVAAAVAANADDFVRALPDGYDTVLGERGATLSGGQRQRLAIARALAKDAPILILDEPTSALDSATEAQVMEALARLMRGRTTLVIAHRLSTIRNADRVCVLGRGRVLEVGTHEALLAAQGAYWRHHALQSPPEAAAG